MTYKPRTKIEIPSNWTGEQAKSIFEFLTEEIAEAIYNVHGERIERAIQKEETILEKAARGELSDDYPF